MTVELKNLLLEAPEDQLDPCMFPFIEKWNEPDPSALQVLEVLDYCVNGALAGPATMALLEKLYAIALINEETTNVEVIKGATWRN